MDLEKFNETESKAREAQIPELHNFKQFSDQIKAGRERQFAALVKENEKHQDDIMSKSPTNTPDKVAENC